MPTEIAIDRQIRPAVVALMDHKTPSFDQLNAHDLENMMGALLYRLCCIHKCESYLSELSFQFNPPHAQRTQKRFHIKCHIPVLKRAEGKTLMIFPSLIQTFCKTQPPMIDQLKKEDIYNYFRHYWFMQQNIENNQSFALRQYIQRFDHDSMRSKLLALYHQAHPASACTTSSLREHISPTYPDIYYPTWVQGDPISHDTAHGPYVLYLPQIHYTITPSQPPYICFFDNNYSVDSGLALVEAVRRFETIIQEVFHLKPPQAGLPSIERAQALATELKNKDTQTQPEPPQKNLDESKKFQSGYSENHYYAFGLILKPNTPDSTKTGKVILGAKISEQTFAQTLFPKDQERHLRHQFVHSFRYKTPQRMHLDHQFPALTTATKSDLQRLGLDKYSLFTSTIATAPQLARP